jgi:hypothetical protein
MKRITVLLIILAIFVTSCNKQKEKITQKNSTLTQFVLNSNAKGVLETIDNIQNITVVSKDALPIKAEYMAGFIQGKLQQKDIIAARDNGWDLMYLLDPSHSFPKLLPPTEEEKEIVGSNLKNNFSYTVSYIQKIQNKKTKEQFTRQLFRMLGIYHGCTKEQPADMDFSGNFVPDINFFTETELNMGYESNGVSWMDIYFLNAFSDIGDYLEFNKDDLALNKLSKCSAFVTKLQDEIIIAHNSWYGFLSQTLTMTLVVNDDIMIFNAIFPGVISSNTDFGYNNKGVLFAETTHHATFSKAKLHSLWSFWRSSLAEQFSSSITEFYDFIAMDISGTYMNGYMVVDGKTKEIGLIEISYQSVVCFLPEKDGYQLVTIPEGKSKAYDPDLVTPTYLLGINYPASILIRNDLKAVENRPARRRQFKEKIAQVKDIQSAKDLITYTDPDNPLSIYGRWDLGYGETPNPKTVPDGSIDAKVASSNDALACMNLKGEMDLQTKRNGFWMKFGTPYVKGEPFIWSKSIWSGQKLRSVPDRVDGSFQLMNTFIK